jgi:hypothetical protein
MRKGFSLLAVLIAIVLSGILIVFLMQILQQGFKGGKKIEIDMDRQSVRRSIVEALDCGLTLSPNRAAACANPIVPKRKRNGANLLDPDGKLGPWRVQMVCGSQGLEVRVSYPIGNSSTDFRKDMGGLPMDLSHPKAALFVGETALCQSHFVATGSCVSESGGFTCFQAFSANGTFTVPAGISKILVEVWGGGGSGGPAGASATTSSGGGGGGSGGYARKILQVTPGQSFPVVVGAGGAGVASTATVGLGTFTYGRAGGPSSFGSIVANGGGPGMSPGFAAGCGGAQTGYSGAGGTATGGDENVTGARGNVGDFNYYHPMGAAGGAGAPSPRGGAFPGGGGAGGNAFFQLSDRASYAGQRGSVVVWW